MTSQSNLPRHREHAAPNRVEKLRSAATAALIGTAALLLTATPASAVTSHAFQGTLGAAGSSPANPYPLFDPTDVGIDQSNGDVYVTNLSTDEQQKLTVQASGGTFSLSFEGKTTGATGEGNLSAATGEGNLSAATGEGNLSYAAGGACFNPNSDETTFLETSSGVFAVGQEVSAADGELPAHTTITAVGPNSLTFSTNPTRNICGAIVAGSREVTGVAIKEGAFEAGERIEGAGIPGFTASAKLESGSSQVTLTEATDYSGGNLGPLHFRAGEQVVGQGIPANTTITAVVAWGTLDLSNPASETLASTPLTARTTIVAADEAQHTITLSNLPLESRAGASLVVGSGKLTGVTTSAGAFVVGQRISGNGIPPDTSIEALGTGVLTISHLPTLNASGVSLSAGSDVVTGLTTSTGAFIPGEEIFGLGIPVHTRIEAVQPGALVLSAPATQRVTGATLSAALPWDATASTVEKALWALSPIGSENVTVSGGPPASGSADLTAGSPEITAVTGGFDQEGQEISGPGIPSGTTFVRPGAGGFPTTWILSNAATETTSGAGIATLSPYQITFDGALADSGFPQFTADSTELTGESPLATVTRVTAGGRGNDIEKFNEAGEFILMFGKDVNKTALEAGAARAGETNVCPAAGHRGDVCQPGLAEESPGAFKSPAYLAVDNTCADHKPQPLTATTTPTCEEFDPSAGDVYVGDPGDKLVSKFTPAGSIIGSWGASGQKNGSDATDTGSWPGIRDVAVNDADGDLYVLSTGVNVWRYSQAGVYIPPIGIPRGLEETLFENTFINPSYAFDPSDGEVYSTESEAVNHSECFPCATLDTFGSGHLTGAMGIAVNGQSHAVYVANSSERDVAVFKDARPIVTTGPPTNVTESEVTLTGHIDPANRGDIVACHFEYGPTRAYGTSLPCNPDPASGPPSSNFTGPTEVTATIAGLSAGTKGHYRLVATNAIEATSSGLDETFITTQPPAIDGLDSANLTATTAELNARVNPNGLKTTYRFDYGTTTNYGQSAPVPEGTLSSSNSDQSINVRLENLVPHVEYHYTLVATNEDGTTTAEDHTFNFYPPSCPNQNIRQQTQSNYLPDCRAYELVSPGYAGGTLLFPGGPNTGQATSPSRFSFTGLYSTIPGAGGSPIDSVGDLYVSTRTDTGWVTRYVGLPSSQTAVDGGPPMGPPLSAGVVGTGLSGTDGYQIGASSEANLDTGADRIQSNVLTNSAMNTFVDWNDGVVESGGGGADNAPYVWSADGSFLERWPTNLSSVSPNADALRCPNSCPGDVTASSDLSHFVFATELTEFASGGQLTPPGSVYDNDVATGAVEVASQLAGGGSIPAEPGEEPGDPLQVPALSTDGSHILIAAGATGGSCGSSFGIALRCQLQPSNLYMRVDNSATYDVSQGHDVTYVGMTPNGSKVYFTSEEHLTNEDPEHGGMSLYMWSEKGEEEHQPLTLVSKADPGSPDGAGNTADCDASFTTKCGVVPYSDVSYCTLMGGAGGNCHSDNSIAAENGDIYFFSPEQLDGTRGIPNQENLYVYRNGAVQYVTTLTTGPFCYGSPVPGLSDSACSDTPIVRMEVTPNDSYMAFVTASQVTQYENAGYLEMYRYQPSTKQIVCVSCNPSGASPTSNVEASEDGLFMTDDGRLFFSTEEALVQGDTDNGEDVYEYVEGRAQLITPGTGDANTQAGAAVNPENTPGLIGVSANGTDVYFSTLETLVPQDDNGLYLKFYDARAGGGFSAAPPPPSCDAADECHGAGTEPPPPLPTGTGSAPGTVGNLTPEAHPGSHKVKHKEHKKRTRKHSSRHRNKHKRKVAAKRRHRAARRSRRVAR